LLDQLKIREIKKIKMWKRLFAAIFDVTIIILPLMIIENAFNVARTTITAVVNGIIWFGYFIGMDYKYGGTIGKRLVGLRVAIPQQAESAIIMRLFLRTVVRSACLILPFSLLYWYFIVWRKDGRSLTDFVSQSTVVEHITLSSPKQVSFIQKIIATILFPILYVALVLAIPFFFMLLDLFGIHIS
jgi:uncharacterized RDD family membrane protein YckC